MELCGAFVAGKHCAFAPDCHFAHGLHELRPRSQARDHFKVRRCHNWPNCNFENRCLFVHDDVMYKINEEIMVYYSNYQQVYRLTRAYDPNHVLTFSFNARELSKNKEFKSLLDNLQQTRKLFYPTLPVRNLKMENKKKTGVRRSLIGMGKNMNYEEVNQNKNVGVEDLYAKLRQQQQQQLILRRLDCISEPICLSKRAQSQLSYFQPNSLKDQAKFDRQLSLREQQHLEEQNNTPPPQPAMPIKSVSKVDTPQIIFNNLNIQALAKPMMINSLKNYQETPLSSTHHANVNLSSPPQHMMMPVGAPLQPFNFYHIHHQHAPTPHSRGQQAILLSTFSQHQHHSNSQSLVQMPQVSKIPLPKCFRSEQTAAITATTSTPLPIFSNPISSKPNHNYLRGNLPPSLPSCKTQEKSFWINHDNYNAREQKQSNHILNSSPEEFDGVENYSASSSTTSSREGFIYDINIQEVSSSDSESSIISSVFDFVFR